MNHNFVNGIVAITREITLFLFALVGNRMLVGFLLGAVIAILVVGFILTKNPKHIPVILRYSSAESFQKIVRRNGEGTYQVPYSNFIKLHARIRTLFLMACVSFGTMVGTILLTYK